MTTGFITGTYGPITNGHVSMIQESLRVVDQLIVCVSTNPSKSGVFTDQQRIDLANRSLDCCLAPSDRSRVIVTSNPATDRKYTVHLAHEYGATVMFRGIRDIKDFEYERQLAVANRAICNHVTTVFLLAKPEEAVISSSLVMSQIGYDGWVQLVMNWVPQPVMDHLLDVHAQGWMPRN